MTTTAQAYRTASLQHASHLDLMLAAYDALAQDMRLAGAAAGSGNIAERCRASNHALLLVGHLESWLPLLAEPALEGSLAQFYTFVRAAVMKHQNSDAANHFTALALLVCEVRAAWQQKGSAAKKPTNDAALPATSDYAHSRNAGSVLSCSA